jgi:hypothetical protein
MGGGWMLLLLLLLLDILLPSFAENIWEKSISNKTPNAPISS